MSRTEIDVQHNSDQSDDFDPIAHPELYDGVLSRRIGAFVIDVTVIFLISCAVFTLFLFLGFVTFGLAWLALGLVFPGVALLYTGLGLSSHASATFGMRTMGLQMRTWYGAKMDFLYGAVHAIGFYISIVALTPFVLFVPLFEPRKRLLHDLILGTMIVDKHAAGQIIDRG